MVIFIQGAYGLERGFHTVALYLNSREKNNMIRIFPVVTEESKKNLVDAAVIAPREVQVTDGITVMTTPYKFDTKVDILGMSTTIALLDTGVIDSTDTIDPSVMFDSIYFKDVAKGVFALNVHNLPYAAFVAAQNNFRTVDANGLFTAYNEDRSTWVSFKLTGEVTLELGTMWAAIQMTGASNNIVFDKLEAVGFDLHATRSNPNRRPHGRTKAENAARS